MGKDYNPKHNKQNPNYHGSNKNKMNENQQITDYTAQDTNNSMVRTDTPSTGNIENLVSKLATLADLATVESNIKNDLKGSIKSSETTLLREIQATKVTADKIDRNLNGIAKKYDIDTAVNRAKNEISNSVLEINQKTENLEIKLNRIFKAVLDNESKSGIVDHVKNISKATETIKKVRDSTDKISNRFDGVEEKLNDISANTEMIQSLPGKIDTVTKILEDKGLQFKQDLPAVNPDEETLAELAECGEKILQQLATAARWYARKLPEINANDKKIEEINAANAKDVQKAAKEGEQRGRNAIIAELLELYKGNIQSLMNHAAENAQNQLEILSTFLKNKDVLPIYELHEEIEITADNLLNYQNQIESINPGKIVITSPGYTFNSKVVEKASYIPAEEFYKQQEQNQENISQEQNQ